MYRLLTGDDERSISEGHVIVALEAHEREQCVNMRSVVMTQKRLS